MSGVTAENMEDDDGVMLTTSQDMEEGELSDDGLSSPESQKPSIRNPIKMDVPDLLRELKGADEFRKFDPETISKMSARAERFQTGSSVSFEEISKLYSFMKVSPEDRESLDRLEMIFVWSPDKLDMAEVQKFFSGYSPLNVDQLSGSTAQVVWATPVNCARAMLALSKSIGVAGTERVVKHVLDMEQEQSYVTEEPVDSDLIHPDDIGVTMPEDKGPWRLAVGDISIMLLRFGRKTDLTMREKQVAARHLGILSKSRREELIQEQEKALQKELEKKKPVDRKNPWGGAAENWALESRGKVGTDFDDFLASYSRDRRRRDWDNPAEEVDSPRQRSGGVRDRLGWGPHRGEREEREEREAEDLEWSSKMKRPRMGMVADMVEMETGRTPLRRKLPHRYDEDEEAVDGDYPDLRLKVEERVVRTAGRRLGERDRFRGGRLEGRLGFSHHPREEEEENAGRRSRLSSRLGARRGMVSEEESGDSLERDNGEDLGGSMVNNMIIRVNRNEEEMQLDEVKEDRTRRKGERSKNTEDREKEIRQRLREIQREKESMEERRKKSDGSRSSRKERERGREGEGNRELINQIKERSKKLGKYKKEEVEESETDSSESEESDSASDSSDESSESDSSSSESEEEESSDEEEERRRRREKERRKTSSSHRQRSDRDREKQSSSKYSHKESKSSSSKSSRKDKQEESKKAAELRDQLRNYLKKAKEAKEKRKK